jgi:hypothetical protein
MAEFWKSHSLLLAPVLSLGAFLPGALPPSLHAVALPVGPDLAAFWSWVSAALGLTCLLAAWIPAGSGPSATGREGVAIETGFLLVPLLALVGISLVTTPIYVLGRTDAIAYPALALLAGRGLARLPRALAGCGLLFWVLLSLWSLAPSYGLADSARVKGADRQLADFISREGLQEGDWLIHTFLTAPSLEYYLEQTRSRHRAAWFPAAAALNPAGVLPTPIDSLSAYLDQALELRNRMDQRLPADGSVWILGLDGPGGAVPRPSPDGHGARAQRTAQQLAYPTSVLVYSLAGAEPVSALQVYRQDWVGGLRVLLRVPRSSWLPLDSLPPLRTGGSFGGSREGS